MSNPMDLKIHFFILYHTWKFLNEIIQKIFLADLLFFRIFHFFSKNLALVRSNSRHDVINLSLKNLTSPLNDYFSSYSQRVYENKAKKSGAFGLRPWQLQFFAHKIGSACSIRGFRWKNKEGHFLFLVY